MITNSFWPFLNHLLSEESEGYDATEALNWVAPTLPALAPKTPSVVERKILLYLYHHIETYRNAPSRILFFDHVGSSCAPYPSEISDLQDYSNKISAGVILRFALNDTQSLMDKYEVGRDIAKLELTVQTGFEIVNAPTKINGKEVHGLQPALDYLQRNIAELGSSVNSIARYNLDEDPEVIYGNYLFEEADPLRKQRVMTGMAQIDETVGGFKPGELVTLIGYTGDGKTTMALSWCYKALLQKKNAVFFTLEMPADDILKRFHIRHALHPKFRGKFEQPIDLKRYMDHTLTDKEKDFLFRTVIPDFRHEHENSNMGSIRVIEPTESGFTFELLKAELLRLNAEKSVDVFFLDYPNLMDVNLDRGQDYDKAMSRLYVKLKTLCRTFNNNQRLVGIIPTQVNRSGREAAEKNQGAYSLRAISDYSEIEKSSDHVFSIFRDAALKDASECLIGHLKARSTKQADSFRATFMGATGVVDSVISAPESSSSLGTGSIPWNV